MKRPALSLALLLPATTIVTAAVAGAVVGIEVSLLVIAGGALVGVIALLWSSVQSLTGESPLSLEEALSLGAPSVEEEQKRAVLRALKDLEFERGVGKISQEDYVELSTRYRAEARRLMQMLDAGSEKERATIERLVAERLAEREKTKKADGADHGTADAPADDASPPESQPAPASDPEAAEEPKSEPARTVKAVEGEGA